MALKILHWAMKPAKLPETDFILEKRGQNCTENWRVQIYLLWPQVKLPEDAGKNFRRY